MAETPPPFNPGSNYAPRKKQNPLLWVLVALVASCGVCIILSVIFSFTAIKQAGNYARCPITMGIAAKGIKDYVKEHGVFPPAKTWQTDTKEAYAKEYDKLKKGTNKNGFVKTMFKEMFDIPGPGDQLVCLDGKTKTGIAYNSDLAGKKPSDFPDVDQEICLFETDSVAINNNGPYEKVKKKSDEQVFGQERTYYAWPYGGDISSKDSSVSFSSSD